MPITTSASPDFRASRVADPGDVPNRLRTSPWPGCSGWLPLRSTHFVPPVQGGYAWANVSPLRVGVKTKGIRVFGGPARVYWACRGGTLRPVSFPTRTEDAMTAHQNKSLPGIGERSFTAVREVVATFQRPVVDL